MNLSETLLASSLEDFLSDEEAVFLLDVLDSHIASLSPDSLIPGRNGRSIHSIDGLEVHQTVAVYEPAGRVEVEVVPAAVDAVMGQAMARRWADVQRAFPSARQLDPWIYVEYGPGQYVTPHVDYAHNDDAPRRPKVAGISVLLNDGFAGGELFVETSGSSRLWHEVDGNPVAA
ncbi:MAG TPA: hypothetical protein VFS16_12925, partial [Acidimicrobiia bacterium]|nr:hypothetical protein [Acidimicrobiia bacterium]